MRKVSLIITITLIIALALLLILQNPKTVKTKKDLSLIENNQKIKISGTVVSEKTLKEFKIITLNNGIELQCDKMCPSYKNKKVEVIGYLDEFYNRIIILKIKAI